jgi:hypothetical protein
VVGSFAMQGDHDPAEEARFRGLRRLSRLTWRATQLGALATVGFAAVFARTAPATTVSSQPPPHVTVKPSASSAAPSPSPSPSPRRHRRHHHHNPASNTAPAAAPTTAPAAAPAPSHSLAPPSTPPAPPPSPVPSPVHTTSSPSPGGGG